MEVWQQNHEVYFTEEAELADLYRRSQQKYNRFTASLPARQGFSSIFKNIFTIFFSKNQEDCRAQREAGEGSAEEQPGAPGVSALPGRLRSLPVGHLPRPPAGRGHGRQAASHSLY